MYQQTHREETQQRKGQRDGQDTELATKEEIKEDDGRKTVLRIAEAEGDSLPCRPCEVENEAEEEQFEQALLAVAQRDAEGGTAEEEQEKEKGLGTWEVIDTLENERYKDGEEAVKERPDRFCVGEGECAERKQKNVELVQIVRHLREKNAALGVVVEELTVGIDVLECEMGSRPLEVLALRECIADARVQRNGGRERERCIDPDDGADSHFFGRVLIWESSGKKPPCAT